MMVDSLFEDVQHMIYPGDFQQGEWLYAGCSLIFFGRE